MQNTLDQNHTQPPQCAACEVILEPVIERQSEDWFACPVCGAGDTRENVALEVQRFFKDHSAKILNDQMRRITRPSSFIKLEKAFGVGGNHRFKVKLD